MVQTSLDPNAPLLRKGETVYLVGGWKKRMQAGQDPVLCITLQFIHGDYAKIAGKSYALDKDFFRRSDAAVARFTMLLQRERKTIETSFKRKCAELDGMIADARKRYAKP